MTKRQRPTPNAPLLSDDAIHEHFAHAYEDDRDDRQPFTTTSLLALVESVEGLTAALKGSAPTSRQGDS